MRGPYRFLIFDLDGTLLDTAEDIAFHANLVLRELGRAEHSLEEVKRRIGQGAHSLLEQLGAGDADPARFEHSVKRFRKSYEERPIIRTAPFPCVTEMLSGRFASVKKAVLTNKPHEVTLSILRTLQLESTFDAVVGYAEGGVPRKPDPAGALALLTRFGEEASKTLFVGDSQVDFDTAAALGIDFAFVDYGYDRIRSGKPAFRFSSACQWNQIQTEPSKENKI